MTDKHYKSIPKSVRIGCYHFRVEVTEFADSEAENQFGHMNQINQKIRVRPGMSPQKLANTFIHEVLHAIYWFHTTGDFSIRQPEANCSPRDIEEEFVLNGANGLCAFWQDNQDAVAWFNKMLLLKEPE